MQLHFEKSVHRIVDRVKADSCQDYKDANAITCRLKSLANIYHQRITACGVTPCYMPITKTATLELMDSNSRICQTVEEMQCLSEMYISMGEILAKESECFEPCEKVLLMGWDNNTTSKSSLMPNVYKALG